jgi:DNA-binding response OmpR family regulator
MYQCSVLLADPDLRDRDETRELLVAQGCTVTIVQSMSEAERLLKQAEFDCAIVAVELEDIRGHEGVSRLHKIAPALPVIVTAADNTRELEAEVRQYDVAYYYVKTFDRAELLEAVKEAVQSSRKGKMSKILLIDDDEDYQAAVRAILENAGYEVVSAYGKDEGKSKLASESPDLIILDIMMETTTAGFHFLYETRGEQEKRVPVLAVSAIADAHGFTFSLTTDDDYFPADGYMRKPVKADELLEHVEKLLKEVPSS